MAARTFILFAAHHAPWRVAVDGRVADVPAEPDEPLERVAQAAAESMRRAGYRGQPVLLAIPSHWCLAASVPLEGLPRRHDRAARLFRFEEKLPLAAEDLVADFIDGPQEALGIAVRLEQLRPVIDVLESNGIAVESIVPSALLTAHATPRAHGSCVLRIDEDDAVDVLVLQDGRPTAWSVAPATEAEVQLHTDLARRASGATEVVRLDEPATAAAARAGRDALRGRLNPWVELRRDALASPDRLRASRRALNVALSSAAALLIVLGAVMLVRAQRYERSARDDERRLVDRFRAEFPGWTVPANVSAVIDSEHRKLAAQQFGAARQASSASALRTLVRVLGALPAGARVALERMSFDDRGFVLDGRVAAPAELDAITASIRSANLRVAPPQAQRDDDPGAGVGGAGGGGAGAWHFTLRGEAPGDSAPNTPPGRVPLAEVTR